MRTFQTLVSASILALAVPATSYFWYSVRSAIKDWLPARANSQPYELYATTTPNPEVEDLLRDIESPSDAARSRAWAYIDRHQFEFTDDEEAKLAQSCATLLREPRRLSESRFIFTLDSFRYLSRERGARESCLSFLADNTLPLPLKDSEVLDLMNRETIEVRLALVRAVMAENGRAVPCQELEGLASRPGNSRFIQSARADLMTSISCRETFKEYFGRNADTEVLDGYIASPAANLLGHISSLRVGGPNAPFLRPAFLRWQCKNPEACAAVVFREPDEVSRLRAQCVLRDLLPSEARAATDSAVQTMPMTELPTECMGHLDGSDPKLPEKLLELLRGNDPQRKSAVLPILRQLPQLLERSDELAEAAGEAFAVTWAFATRSDALLQQLSPRTREILQNASRRSAHSLCGGRPCPDISHYLRPPGQSPAQFQQSILTVLGYLREAMIRGDARVERHAVADFLDLS
ncbi:MAG: hypothetical protein IT290_11230, partial [Deltaproteobacteria bacterium]|nr:hypothetical protein [Deltaproteobacteria bacterium]